MPTCNSQAQLRMLARIVLLSLGVPLAIGSVRHAAARILVVAQDGSGDYLLVSEALDATVSGDTILIRPGEYDEYDGDDYTLHASNKVLAFRGSGLLPSDTSLRLSLDFDSCTVSLENLRFHHEVLPIRSYSFYPSSDSMIIRHCRFDANRGMSYMKTSAAYGGAVQSTGAAMVTLEDCEFVENIAEADYGRGGAVCVNGGATIRNCRFIGNGCTGEGGALWVCCSPIEVTGCVFLRNWAYDAAAFALGDFAQISDCTVYGNELRDGSGSAITMIGVWNTPVSHCIIARTINGYAADAIATFECCDEWQNDQGLGGPWCVFLDRDGNFHADPLLCNPDANDIRLQAASPCWPGVHGGKECGLIGASGVVCGDVPTEPVTWGRLKSLFRW